MFTIVFGGCGALRELEGMMSGGGIGARGGRKGKGTKGIMEKSYAHQGCLVLPKQLQESQL